MFYFAGILIAALLLAGLEVALRYRNGLPVPFLRRDPLPKARGLTSFFRESSMILYHRSLGWTMAPRLTANADGCTTDDYGNRMNLQKVRPLPLGSIVICGNSFAAGSDVLDTETWSAYLERRLRVPVINAACGGWGADQIIMRTEEMLSLAEPQVVVVSLLSLDFRRAECQSYHGARKAYFVPAEDGVRIKGYPVSPFNEVPGPLTDRFYTLYRLARWWRDLRGVKPELYSHALPEGVGIEITKRLLSRLKAAADAAGSRVILLAQYGGAELRDFHDQLPMLPDLLAHARAIGIECIDDWAQWRKLCLDDHQAFRQLFRQFDDPKTLGHWTPPGNKIVADAVAERIGAVKWRGMSRSA